MNEVSPSPVAPVCLVIGAVLGLGGSFAPSSVRGLAWGLDGIALIVAAAFLVVHFLRRGEDTVAAGFIVFVAGQTLVTSGSAQSLEASAASFGVGAGLWAAALLIVSAPNVMPKAVRAVGCIAALLLAATALQILAGRSLTPLSEPLPFFAYPFLVFTLLGWAWWCRRPPNMR